MFDLATANELGYSVTMTDNNSGILLTVDAAEIDEFMSWRLQKW